MDARICFVLAMGVLAGACAAPEAEDDAAQLSAAQTTVTSDDFLADPIAVLSATRGSPFKRPDAAPGSRAPVPKFCDITGTRCVWSASSTFLAFDEVEGSHDILRSSKTLQRDGTTQLKLTVRKAADINGTYPPFDVTFAIAEAKSFENVQVEHVSNGKMYSATVACIATGSTNGLGYLQAFMYVVPGNPIPFPENMPDYAGGLCARLVGGTTSRTGR